MKTLTYSTVVHFMSTADVMFPSHFLLFALGTRLTSAGTDAYSTATSTSSWDWEWAQPEPTLALRRSFALFMYVTLRALRIDLGRGLSMYHMSCMYVTLSAVRVDTVS